MDIDIYWKCAPFLFSVMTGRRNRRNIFSDFFSLSRRKGMTHLIVGLSHEPCLESMRLLHRKIGKIFVLSSCLFLRWLAMIRWLALFLHLVKATQVLFSKSTSPSAPHPTNYPHRFQKSDLMWGETFSRSFYYDIDRIDMNKI